MNILLLLTLLLLFTVRVCKIVWFSRPSNEPRGMWGGGWGGGGCATKRW